MRIGIVGGIFGKPDAYRATVGFAPETVLAAGLAERGHEVVTRGHYGPFDLRGDVLHVHHLSFGAFVAAAGSVPFAFTSHRVQERTASRRRAARFVIARADASVVLSSTELGMQSHGAPAARERWVIPNGIDARTFRYAAPRPLDGPLELLYVGQMIRLKGVDVLLRAIHSLRGTPPVRLRLAYHVDQQETALRALAGELGVEAEFLGPCKPARLAELYARCHALVLPSVTGEALPSAVTEAILVGRPVIASSLAAIPEQVGRFGCLVPPGQVAELASAIRSLASGYGELAAGSHAASRQAAERYSIDAMVARHEELYEHLVARGPTSRDMAARVLGAAARVAAAQRRRR